MMLVREGMLEGSDGVRAGGRTLGCTKTHLNQGAQLQHWTAGCHRVEQHPATTRAQSDPSLPPTAHLPFPPVSPRNETAEKPTAGGERKRKYKKNQTTKPCTFGASIDPAVGNQRVPPVLRPSGLMAPMGCQEMSVTIRPPIPP